MEYTMEELVPIVGKLAEKYTAFESTSVTYEKAEQLMEAVLYCVREVELSGREQECGDGKAAFENKDAGCKGAEIGEGEVLPAKSEEQKMSAQKAYELGAVLVEKKVKRTLALYNELSTDFAYYENHCLYDVFVKGMPEFLKWYDVKFNPQDTILTLDYPVPKDLSKFTGIDEIYAYLNCIRLEQAFLKRFPEEYVVRVSSKWDEMENLCEIIFLDVSGHVLAGKPMSEREFSEEDYQKIKGAFSENGRQEICGWLKQAIKTFLEKDYEGEVKNENNSICEEREKSAGYRSNVLSEELYGHFADCVENIVVRLKNAADNGVLGDVL